MTKASAKSRQREQARPAWNRERRKLQDARRRRAKRLTALASRLATMQSVDREFVADLLSNFEPEPSAAEPR